MERAANAGEFEYVDTHNASFVKAARKLISDIDDMLMQIHADNLKPKREKPDKGTLDKLREACVNYEMNNVDAAISELEAFEYESDGELVIWLRKNAEQTNFDEIAERLSDLSE